MLLALRALESLFSTKEQSSSISHLGYICGNLSGLLLWFVWLRRGHVNKLAVTAFGVGTLGVIIMDRRILRSIQERGRDARESASLRSPGEDIWVLEECDRWQTRKWLLRISG